MKTPARAGFRSNGEIVPVTRGKKLRTCPKCEAKPGWSCVKIDAWDMRKPLKTMHKER